MKQCRNYPLMAKDVGHILSMILVPRVFGGLFSTFLSDGMIDDTKSHAPNLYSQRIEEQPRGNLDELLLSRGVFSQKSGEAWKGSWDKRRLEGLNHRRGVGFAQLDKTRDKRGEDLEREF